MNTKGTLEKSRLEVEREKIAADMSIAQTQLAIARENKNKYDNPSSKKKEDK